MQTRSATSSQPADDIHAILGRFEAWSGTQGKAPKGGIKDIKELSYDQALKSSRFRRVEAPPSPAPPPKMEAPPPAKARVTPPARKLSSTPATKAAAKVSSKTGARAVAKAPPAAEAKFRETLNRALQQQAAPSAAIKKNPGKAPAGAASAARPIMLSVRISPSEQSLIRQRAEEANLSISAYMRQCTLEVEQLRRQVELTLARLERQAAPALSPMPPLPPPGAGSGFFGRITRRLLGLWSPSGSGRPTP
ncbi:plasmid mobilization protein [Acidipila rosea]|uniref:Uncharacterized protein n=1 Tax=Acidipila rosea TaxID=768535 RepID=A0A4R1L850_9BACT|nr:hypothetical protein [Acidipila rosea]TCK72519.1 hypothetical protein C7378_2101 [Acidipila rosea]